MNERMVKRKSSCTELDTPTKTRIVEAFKDGRKISQIASFFHSKWSTCKDVVQKFFDSGSVHNKSRSGRPPKVTDRAHRHLIRNALKNRQETLESLSRSLPIKITKWMVQWHLACKRLHHRHAIKTPYLSPYAIKVQFAFAKHCSCFIAKWFIHIIWSDKCMIIVDDYLGPHYVT